MNNYEMLRARYSEQDSSDATTTVDSANSMPDETKATESDEVTAQPAKVIEPLENQNRALHSPELQHMQIDDNPGSESSHNDAPVDEHPVSPESFKVDEPQSECSSEMMPHDENAETSNMLVDLNRNMEHTNAVLDTMLHALEAQKLEIQAIRQTVALSDSSAEQVKKLAGNVEELKQSSVRHEKANIDVLRDSKNFQATIREQMQRELDAYHKLHSSTAYAPILIEIANLYITTQKAISYVTDEKVREHFTDLILESISDILTDQGVDIHSTEVGQVRSIRTCKTRKTIPTGDKSLHGLVAASNHPSFSLGNLVLIKESIDTYIYDESLDTKADANDAPVSDELTE